MKAEKHRAPGRLKPQDVLLACKLYALGDGEWTFGSLSRSLGLSASAAHGAWQRLRKAGIVAELSDGLKIARRRLFELLAHGAPLTFYAERGPVAHGMLTGFHAEPVKVHGVQTNGAMPLVWAARSPSRSPRKKSKKGPGLGTGTLTFVQGESVEPIYPSAPAAALEDVGLYEMLALFDAVRVGEPKERRTAIEILERKLRLKEEVSVPSPESSPGSRSKEENP